MTAEKVLAIVSGASGKAADRTAKLEELGLDSLETLDLFLELDVPAEAIDGLHTVDDLVRYLEAR